MKSGFSGRGAIDVSRFKGLGEMSMRDLRDTTMDPAKRTLLRVALVEDDSAETADAVERLMGASPRRASPSSRNARPRRANSSIFNRRGKGSFTSSAINSSRAAAAIGVTDSDRRPKARVCDELGLRPAGLDQTCGIHGRRRGRDRASSA